MTEYRYEGKNPKQQAGPGACNLILNGVLCYFMYTYAFNNPDVEKNGMECWASNGDNMGFGVDLNGRKNVSK